MVRIATRHRHGVTLLELLAVLLILVIFAGFFVGGFVRQRQVALLRSESQQIQALIGLARSRAITESVPQQLVFWPDQPAYWIDRLSPDGLSIEQSQVTTPQPVNRLLRLDMDVETVYGSPATNPEGNLVTIFFRPDGSSDSATFWMRRRAADPTDPTEYYSIRLYGPTGRSRVFPNQRL